jgi:hypothetical protein
MKAFNTAILLTGVATLAGCASWDKSPICHKTHGWNDWSDVRCHPPEASNETGPDLAAELAAARNQNRALNSR